MAIKKKSAAKKPAAKKAAAKRPAASVKTRAKAAPPRASRKRPIVAEPAPARKRASAGVATPVVEAVDLSTYANKKLVIVESPAKAKTIGKYLGPEYRVRATVGHVRDLPEKGLGIDIENGFAPKYVPVAGKEKTLEELKGAASVASHIYLATDPDREGEAIAWHVAESIREEKAIAKSKKDGKGKPAPAAVAKRKTAPIQRVLFHEITKEAVQAAIKRAGRIDERKVNAQQARRVLDRLVGYKASPLLWKTVKKGLSAGRVQTVALRLIVEREREIRAFKPVEYWTIDAQLEKAAQKFIAKLHQVDGKKPEIGSESVASAILKDLKGRDHFQVTEVRKRERRKNPAAPFTTSTMQQEGAKKLSFGSRKTMRVAQDLYEGIELGKEGSVGLITYMRTDSTRVAPSAAEAARAFLKSAYGADSLAKEPQLYGKAGQANTQDAHEAVRPTDPERRPDDVKRYLSAEQFKLYELIWKRFMASQMAAAIFDTTTVDFDLGRYLFRSTGSVVKFEGFLALYRETHEEGEGRALEDEQALPALDVKENVPVRAITPHQHFTEPPPRFSEASLVKELERLGIGRPSTYASIISVLADRRYVLLEQRRFTPTPLGETVEKIMVLQFPDVFNVSFTSEMEGELDRVEEGELGWQRVLKDFWSPFNKSLEKADVLHLIGEAHDLSFLKTERCPKCGGKLEAKGGIFGPYVACVNRPATCDFTRPLGRDRKPAVMTNEICQLCGAPMVIRTGRSGEFLGCSRFPKCRGTRALPIGVKCPKDGGDLIQLRSKKGGRPFYGCANHPNCDFICWNKPVLEKCPDCGNMGAESKHTKARGDYRKCLKCGNEWAVAPEAEPAAAS
jgi:DNA topoisomerase-1